MNNEDDFEERLKRSMEIFKEYINRVTSLPLNQKIEESRNLDQQRRDLNEEITIINMKKSWLHSLEDVADYRVIDDDVSRTLLIELQERGDVLFPEFMSPYDKLESSAVFIYLTRLQTAGFIQMRAHPSDVKKDSINLTEKGRNFRYTGEP